MLAWKMNGNVYRITTLKLELVGMAQTQPIRVLIVDDQDMLRRGLAVFLRTQPDIELVGEACDGSEAIELCDRLQPDVVLMDMLMPGIDGPTAIRAILQKH